MPTLSRESESDVRTAIREARIKVVGEYDLGNDAHAKVLVRLLRAFGDSAAGFLYVEPATILNAERPADVVLCHPKTGVIVVEVKGWTSATIDHVEAGNFYLKKDGFCVPQNPIRQAIGKEADARRACVSRQDFSQLRQPDRVESEIAHGRCALAGLQGNGCISSFGNRERRAAVPSVNGTQLDVVWIKR
jgi:hypothetical protein